MRTPPGSDTAAGTTDWTAELAALDRARSAAFAGTGLLTAVDVAGSSAYAGDQQRLAALERQGLRPRGLHPVLAAVRPVAVTSTGARLLVTDSLPAYDLMSAAGAVVARAPARPIRSWTVSLRRTPAGWRIAMIDLA